MYKIPINVERRINSLQFKQRNKTIMNMLLNTYGSFEEMALCGVEGRGRSGYAVPLAPKNNHILGLHANDLESDIELLNFFIAENKLHKTHIYTYWHPQLNKKS